MIKGVMIHPLKKIPDERGMILHMLRNDEKHFRSFGEVYFSLVYPGIVKGWHLHKKMSLNYAVPIGMIKLVLYDDRKKSPTRGELLEIITGEHKYELITIPPGVWNGFKGIGTVPALIANCSTHPHDSKEIIRMDPLDTSIIKYDWSTKFK